LKKILSYKVHDIEPYINWLYFFHAWQVTGKSDEIKEKLRADACKMLRDFDDRYNLHAVFCILDANSEGDDLIVDGMRIPMLRQQKPSAEGKPNLCLADFIRPESSGIKDKIGMFATTVDTGMETDYAGDPYNKMMAQVLADRLAEATAEKMHEDVRKKYWGYAKDEQLTMDELHLEKYQGIRPAVGYPSLPDTSVNFMIDRMIGMKEIGIRLTESGAMKPHASVSGFMFAHPDAFYFDLGKIGEDQLKDYAYRRGVPVEMMRRFLENSLLKK